MKRAFFALAALLASASIGSATAPLRTVQKVFIEKMENDFDNDLRVQITRQFKGKVNVVLDREIADAILVGVNKDEKSTSGGKATLRYLGLDSVTAGTLTLIDKSGKIILWSDEAGDRAPWFSSNGVIPTVRKTVAEHYGRFGLDAGAALLADDDDGRAYEDRESAVLAAIAARVADGG